MTSELIERVARAIDAASKNARLGQDWEWFIPEAQAAIAAMQADATPVAWLVKHPTHGTEVTQQKCTEADLKYGWTETPLYAHSPVADRETVRTEQAAELAKFKALAETLAGALEAAAYALHTISESSPDCMGWEPPYPSTVSAVSVEAKAATEALRQYKEARDAP